MSRATVRDAIATTITGVTGLTSVFARPVKIIEGKQKPSATVHISDMREERAGINQKLRRYTCHLLIDFLSVKPKAEDAQTDLDTMLEALEARLRTQKTLGGAVLEAGEPEFTTEMALAHTTEQGKTGIAALMTFEVLEDLVGV